MLLDFRPRFVGGHGVEARYRDVCSIARSLRGLLDVCSIPAEGTRRAPDRPAQPADLVPPVEPPPGGGETARSCGVRGYGVMLHGAPSNRAGAPPAPPVCTAWTIGCAAEWRRGVGRQARQSGGLYCIDIHVFFEFRYFGNGTSQLYPSLTIFDAIKDCRTAPLFDRPEKHRASTPQPIC